MNKNILQLCEQEHSYISKTCMCVYFYTFHQAKFSNLLRFTSRSLELCHQRISFILLSVFGLNNVILSRPSKDKIYLLTDYQYQRSPPINTFLFSFRNAWGWTDTFPALKYHLMHNKHFDPFTKKLYFKKGARWVVRWKLRHVR